MQKLFRIVLTLLFLITLPVSGQADDASEKSLQIENPASSKFGSVDQEAMTDIFDIKPPESVGFNMDYVTYPVIVISVILLLALISFLIYRFIKSRNRKQRDFITVSPDELANNRLDELEESKNHSHREFYFILSSILREYIEKRYCIEALEMTREELIPATREIELEESLRHGLRYFVDSSEVIKYAGDDVMNEKAANDLQFVREFVNVTKKNNETESEKENKA